MKLNICRKGVFQRRNNRTKFREIPPNVSKVNTGESEVRIFWFKTFSF